MKEFLDVVIFHFHKNELKVTGCDADKVGLLQAVFVNENESFEVSTNLFVATPLLEIYKFLRGSGDTDTVLLTVENLDDKRKILAGRILTESRNSWYRFAYVDLPFDVVTFDPQSIEVKCSYILPTKIFLKGIREIVHSHVLLRLRMSTRDGFILETFNKNTPGAGGGKVKFTISEKDIPEVSEYDQRFLVRYIQKFIRIVPAINIQIVFPVKEDVPIQFIASHHEHSVRLVLSPYVEA